MEIVKLVKILPLTVSLVVIQSIKFIQLTMKKHVKNAQLKYLIVFLVHLFLNALFVKPKLKLQLLKLSNIYQMQMEAIA